MKAELRPYQRLEILKGALLAVSLVWAAYASLTVVRNKPEVVLIGLDGNGTRIIQSQNDPLLPQERLKLVKDVLFRLYNYDAANYEKRLSSAGDLMSDATWAEQEKAFKQNAEQIKTRPLRSEARLLDLRELDDQTFEADVGIRITERLTVRDKRLRVGLSIAPKKRNVNNPYAWEVTAFHENELH